ncbi:MAG: hypothetical protein KAQ98_14000 [Bacteriovoracaceae bacterium]|nr:hypothetical protein [Bacteriovoracaceae bacterium]
MHIKLGKVLFIVVMIFLFKILVFDQFLSKKAHEKGRTPATKNIHN